VSTTKQAATARDHITPGARSMRAVIQDRYGSAEVLRHATIARPATGERALVLSPFVKQELRMVLATVKRPALQALSQLIDAGQVTPIIDTTYPLSDAPDAIRRLCTGQAHGKLAIQI
jgi:D-arabinose 1-dehydrogenase-like Zn-dependent alcohol dehydrogenase